MTTSKDDVKKWLKKIGKDRIWLAKQCGAKSKRTVDDWLSTSKNIPEKSLIIIQRLMDESKNVASTHVLEELPNQECLGKMFITLEAEVQEIVYSEAFRIGLSVSAYCSLAVEYAASHKEMREIILQMHSDKKSDSKKRIREDIPDKYMKLMKFPRIEKMLKSEKQSKNQKSINTTASLPAPLLLSNLMYTYDVMGNIAAGSLAEGDTIPYPVKIGRELDKDEYILKVNGKSMEPEIEDGSLIIVKRYTVPPIPKLGTIIEYNDERGVTLKKLGRRKTEEGKMEYVLKSINPAYPDIDPMDGGKISAVFVEKLEDYKEV